MYYKERIQRKGKAPTWEDIHCRLTYNSRNHGNNLMSNNMGMVWKSKVHPLNELLCNY